jgi:GntR family transcriptional regulator
MIGGYKLKRLPHSVPRYIAIKEELKNEIFNGIYEIGSYLPSEHQLSLNYKVTRSTIRHALEVLREEGLIQVVQGKGSKVLESRIEHGLLKMFSYGQQKILTTTKLLEIKKVNSRNNVASHLNIHHDTDVYQIKMLRYYQQQPFIIEISYLPIPLAEGIEGATYRDSFVYNYLEQHQHMRIANAEEFIKAETAKLKEADILNIRKGTPVFYAERSCYDVKGNPIEFRKSIIRCDLVPFYTNTYCRNK